MTIRTDQESEGPESSGSYGMEDTMALADQEVQVPEEAVDEEVVQPAGVPRDEAGKAWVGGTRRRGARNVELALRKIRSEVDDRVADAEDGPLENG